MSEMEADLIVQRLREPSPFPSEMRGSHVFGDCPTAFGPDLTTKEQREGEWPELTGLPNIPGLVIERELGSGGAGKVYLARQVSLGRLVAVKLLRYSHAFNAESRKRFTSEAHHLAVLDHVNVVKVYKSGDYHQLPYIVMEYVNGENLQEYREKHRLCHFDIAQIVLQAAEGIAHSHEHSIIHRDIKPSNILVTTADTSSEGKRLQVKITDFGMAVDEFDRRITKLDRFVGTPAYSSPEQIGGDPVTTSTDIFSLGIVLYELLTGKLPFEGRNLGEQTYFTIHKDPTPPSKSDHSISLDLETICLKCLQKKQADRYATASELALDLRLFLKGKPILARTMSLGEKLRRLIIDNPVLAGVSLTAICILCGSLLVISLLLRQSESQRVAVEHALDKSRINSQYARESVDQLLVVLNDRLNDSEDIDLVRHELLSSTLDFYNRMLKDQAYDPALRESTAQSLLRVGQLHQLLGNSAAAMQAWKESVSIVEALAESNTERGPTLHYLLAQLKYHSANCAMSTNKEQQAEVLLSEVPSQTSTLFNHPTLAIPARILQMRAHSSLGAIFGRTRRTEKSREMHLTALSAVDALLLEAPHDPAILELAIDVRTVYVNTFHSHLGYDQTLKYLVENVAAAEKACTIDKSKLYARLQLARTLNNLADYYIRKQYYSAAELPLRRSIQIASELTEKRTASIPFASLLAVVHSTQGELHLAERKYLHVIPFMTIAINKYRSILPREPSHRTACLYLWQCLQLRAQAYERLGMHWLAILDLEQALATMQVPPKNNTDIKSSMIRQHTLLLIKTILNLPSVCQLYVDGNSPNMSQPSSR